MKRFLRIFSLAMIFIVGFNAFLVNTYAADTTEVQWEQGTIRAASGDNTDNARVIRTKDYLNIADYHGLTLNEEYFITYFVYDANHKYLGNGNSAKKANFLLSGEGVSTAEMLIRYPTAVYFRIAMWQGESKNMTVSGLKSSGVKFIGADTDSIFWEMGSIYAKNGETFVRDQILRTVGFLPASEYEGFTVKKGYALSFLAYDESLRFLGNGNPEKSGYFLGSGVPLSIADIIDQYPATKYVKILLRTEPISDITMSALDKSEFCAYKKGESLPITTYIYKGLDVDFDMTPAYGALNTENGVWSYSTDSFVSSKYMPLSRIEKILWNESCSLSWCVYDAELKFIGGGEIPTGGVLTRQYILEKYKNADLLLICVKPSKGDDVTLAQMTESADVTIYSDINGDNKMTFSSAMVAKKSQDGAIYKDSMFLFNASGTCTVYNIDSREQVGSFKLDKLNLLKPHANSVCFGTEFYSESDKFPLLYVNIYNNYKSESDRKEGVCCVYRIVKQGSTYSSILVQVIKIGFVEDTKLWKSEGSKGDRLPYGNFVVDTDENMLYAFVLRDKDKTTRFFKFKLPAVADGQYDKTYGCNVVTLSSDAILDMFDVGYFGVIQGCAYANGKIYSTNGLGADGSSYKFADLRIIDLKTKSVCNKIDFEELRITVEPEMIAFNEGGDGKLYYLSVDGILRRLDLGVEQIHDAVGQISLKQGDSLEIIGESVEPANDQADSVIEIKDGCIYAIGAGAANVSVDGVIYRVTVPATEQTTVADETTTSPDTTEAPKTEGGCGGLMSVGMITCILPAAILLKKKKYK